MKRIVFSTLVAVLTVAAAPAFADSKVIFDPGIIDGCPGCPGPGIERLADILINEADVAKTFDRAKALEQTKNVDPAIIDALSQGASK